MDKLKRCSGCRMVPVCTRNLILMLTKIYYLIKAALIIRSKIGLCINRIVRCSSAWASLRSSTPTRRCWRSIRSTRPQRSTSMIRIFNSLYYFDNDDMTQGIDVSGGCTLCAKSAKEVPMRATECSSCLYATPRGTTSCSPSAENTALARTADTLYAATTEEKRSVRKIWIGANAKTVHQKDMKGGRSMVQM